MPPKHQGFCFTHNNYSSDDCIRYRNDNWFRFIAFGHELAPTTDTPHLQGFIWTHEPKPLAHMKRHMPCAAVFVPGEKKGVKYHVEDDGVTGFGYVLKEHQPGYCLQGIPPSEEEFIAQCPKGQGKRTDLLAVKQSIDEGKNCDTLMASEDHFGTFASHRKYFQEYQAYKRRRTTFTPPQVIVYYGGPGSNKTRSVYETIPDLDDFYKWEPQNDKWFDGYVGQKYVLFDEFRGQFPYGMLLSLLDGYPGTRVQFKGGMVHWSPTHIYITSPQSPQEWYPNLAAADSLGQLMRRLTTIHALAI